MSDDREEDKKDTKGEPGNTVPFTPHDTGLPRRHTQPVQIETSQSIPTPLLEVATYPRKLLSVARQLIEQGQPSIAVIVAHMACEVATERRLSEAFVTTGVQHLKDAVTEFLNGYSLYNRKNRKLYEALTRDKVAQTPFWPNFKKSAKRRNDIIHAAHTVGRRRRRSPTKQPVIY